MMKKSGGKKPGHGSGGGLGALAALQGAMGGAAGGAPGGAPMGPPPGMGGPPPGPPGGGMPPPGMKKGGHVHKMNAGGKPGEDEPLRQAKRKAKELTIEKGIQKEEKADKEGDMKYARGGRVAMNGPHGVGDETANRLKSFSGKNGHGKNVNGERGQDLEHLHKAHSDHVRGVKAFAKGGATNGPAKVNAKGHSLDKADGGNQKEDKGTKDGEFRYAKGGHVSGFRSAAHGIESKGKTKGRCI